MKTPEELAPWVQAFLERHSEGDHLDEEVLLREQAGLSPEQIVALRYAPEVARRCFGVLHLEAIDAGYYFWDTTTLSLKQPLLDHVRDGMSVLEVGPGPAATLSLFLAGRRRGLKQVCAEVDPRFAAGAREAIRLNGAAIEVVESDLVAKVSGRFDVVFTNPPYMPADTLSEIGIREGTGVAQAGHGGADGLDVVRRFLGAVPGVLVPGGKVLLGLNTRHVPTAQVLTLIDHSPCRLVGLAWPEESVQPAGLRASVFILAAR